jgi:hypothetical protein
MLLKVSSPMSSSKLALSTTSSFQATPEIDMKLLDPGGLRCTTC